MNGTERNKDNLYARIQNIFAIVQSRLSPHCSLVTGEPTDECLVIDFIPAAERGQQFAHPTAATAREPRACGHARRSPAHRLITRLIASRWSVFSRRLSRSTGMLDRQRSTQVPRPQRVVNPGRILAGLVAHDDPRVSRSDHYVLCGSIRSNTASSQRTSPCSSMAPTPVGRHCRSDSHTMKPFAIFWRGHAYSLTETKFTH